MAKVTFIGLGEIGGAIAHVIGLRAKICAWDKDPAKVLGGVRSMEEALSGADVVFLCIPSWVIRDVATQAAGYLSPQTIVISLAKGLEADSLKTMDVVLQEVLPEYTVGVMGGPLLAEELMADLPGVGVLGAKKADAFQVLQPLFADSNLRLEYTNDSTAVAHASVLKNIYAVALGIAEGLGWGWNGKGWLAARGLKEMKEIMAHLKCDVSVASGTAGAGDFLATALSPDSFNRTTGLSIAKTGECTQPSEGCRAVASVISRLGKKDADLPILFSLDRIINQHESPKTAFQNLFASEDAT
ncbi:NAD(P)-binding domain-containing protein [Candidatus Uhrbacteria bacterium]|nr:NAD(P)-binding domain-containing protein [Candidatus Uhrbacteria bacterium]